MNTSKKVTAVCYNPETQEYDLFHTTYHGDMSRVVDNALNKYDEKERSKIHIVCLLNGHQSVPIVWPYYVDNK